MLKVRITTLSKTLDAVRMQRTSQNEVTIEFFHMARVIS